MKTSSFLSNHEFGGRGTCSYRSFCEREDKEGVLGNKGNNDSKHEPQVNDGAYVCVNEIETIMDATINNNNGRLHKKSLEIKGTPPHTHMYAFVNYTTSIGSPGPCGTHCIHIYIYTCVCAFFFFLLAPCIRSETTKKNQIIHSCYWIFKSSPP